MHRDEIIAALRRLAEERVPEWHFDTDNPDAGSAFALTFAEMLEDSYQRIRRLPEKHHSELLNAAALPMAAPQAASGAVVFTLAEGAEEGCAVPAATPVYTDDGVAYATDRAVYVTPSRLQAVYYTRDDEIYRVGGEAPFTLFAPGENRQSHILYIGHDWLPNTGTAARFDLYLTGTGIDRLACPDIARWQCYTGEWTDMADVSLTGAALSMTARHPPQACGIEGVESYWIRCLSLSAQSAAIRIHSAELCVNTVEPCAVRIYRDDTELDSAAFYPFGKSLTAYAECHMACDTAFGKPGAVVELGFSVENVIQEIQNPVPEMPPSWKRALRKQNLTPPPVYDVEIADLTVEYWNGQDFVWLRGMTGRWLPEMAGSARQSVSFVCPGDMAPIVLHGLTARWLRLRVTELTHAYKPNARHIVPRVTGLTANVRYPDTRFPCRLAARNNGRYNDPRVPFDYSYNHGRAVYFGFDRPFGGSPVGVYRELAESAAIREPRWSVNTGGTWASVTATGTFGQSGVMTWFCESEMRASECFGETLCWLRAEWDEDPPAPVMVLAMRMGAVAATQIFPADTPHPPDGNCPAHSVCKLDRSIGYIASVTNPAPMMGGKSAETPAEYTARGAGRLRHRNRAVTAQDFQDLAEDVMGGLVQCKALAGINAEGTRQSGAVTMVCLPDRRGDITPLRGERLRTYLQSRAAPGVSVYVRETAYTEISVWARVRTVAPLCPTLREDIARALTEFLHPIGGNYQKSGYAIGETLSHDHIDSFLQALPHVVGLDGFTAETTGDGVLCPLFAVPISGRHHIEVVMSP